MLRTQKLNIPSAVRTRHTYTHRKHTHAPSATERGEGCRGGVVRNCMQTRHTQPANPHFPGDGRERTHGKRPTTIIRTNKKTKKQNIFILFVCAIAVNLNMKVCALMHLFAHLLYAQAFQSATKFIRSARCQLSFFYCSEFQFRRELLRLLFAKTHFELFALFDAQLGTHDLASLWPSQQRHFVVFGQVFRCLRFRIGDCVD